MTKLNIINADTVKKRIRNYLRIGLAGIAMCLTPGIVIDLHSDLIYNERKIIMGESIRKDEFATTERLLETYEEHNTLTPSDISELELKLENAIQKVHEHNTLTPSDISELELKLENAEQIVHEHPTKTLSTIAKQLYSHHPHKKRYDRKTVEKGFNELLGRFSTVNDEKVLYESLVGFQKSMQTRKAEELKTADFERLEQKAETYLTQKRVHYREKLTHSISAYENQKGDPIVIISKQGDDVEGKRQYAFEDTPTDIPLLSVGSYLRTAYFPTLISPHLIKINGEEHWFKSSELSSGVPLKNLSFLDEIEKSVDDILAIEMGNTK